MKHVTRASIALGFAAIMPVTALLAQDNAPASIAVAQFQVSQRTNIRDFEARWEAALEQQLAGNLRESLEGFTGIAKEQKESGFNAAETYWKIAEVQNALGSHLRTARALDDVAREAARFGDVELQARALFEAAINYTAASQHNNASNRMRRLDGLVQSPAISDELRARIAQRRGNN